MPRPPRFPPAGPRARHARWLLFALLPACAEMADPLDDASDRWNPPDAGDDGRSDDTAVDRTDTPPPDDGSADDGSADEASPDDATVDDGAPDDAMADEASPDDGAADDATADDGAADDTGVDDGAVDDAGPTSCGGVMVGGSCWYLGADETWTCTRVCAAHGGYDEATRTCAGSGGTNANCDDVLDALGMRYRGVSTLTGSGVGIGCLFMATANVRYRVADTPTTPDATYILSRRACACRE